MCLECACVVDIMLQEKETAVGLISVFREKALKNSGREFGLVRPKHCLVLDLLIQMLK